MNFKKIVETTDSIGNAFEKLVVEDKILYQSVPTGYLEPWGQHLVQYYLDEARLNWILGDTGVIKEKGHQPAYIIKIDHPQLFYVDIMPETKQWMWISKKDHSDAAHPDEALAILTPLLYPGTKARAIVDDKRGSILEFEHGGQKITIVDPRTGEDRQKS